MKRILVLCYSQLHRDPRVRRQLHFLRERYALTAAGLSDPAIEGVEYVQLLYPRPRWWGALAAARLALHRYEAFYWGGLHIRHTLAALGGRSFDLIIANDLNTLPDAARLARACGARLLLDAHEYEPGQSDSATFKLLLRPYWIALCRRWLPAADRMISSSPGFSRAYEAAFGVRCGTLTNAPFFADLTPSPVSEDEIRLVHHGGIDPPRRQENMIYLVKKLDRRFTLDLMLLRNKPDYYARLQRLAAGEPRIRFVPPAHPDHLAEAVQPYDMGLYPLWPGAFNVTWNLPNKVFEFVQGRLGMALWPSPEMAKVANEYGLGIVSENYDIDELAARMNALTADDVRRYKQAAHAAAPLLCAERNRDLLLNLVEELL